MLNPQDEFRDIIRELAQEETKRILQNEDLYRNIMGNIVDIKANGKYDVDIATTVLHNIINQSGTKLSLGDGVIVSEKYGSNYANCYISAKTSTSDDVQNNIKDVENNIKDISDNQMGGLTFSVNENETLLIVTLPNGHVRYASLEK